MLPPEPGKTGRAGCGYFVRTATEQETGPYSEADLKRMAREGELDLASEISKDRVHWFPAGQVKNLLAEVETALAKHLPVTQEYRNLTKTEVAALFLDKFVLNNENFQDAFPGVQQLRLWWTQLTMPKDFVIVEVTASGVRHVKYNIGTGESSEIDEKEVNKKVARGVHQFNWFVLLAAVLGGVWIYWAVRDFVLGFSLTWTTLKTLLLVGIALFGFVMKVKHSKVFLGYSLDEAAALRLAEVAEAVRVLQRCCHVWIYELTEGGEAHWKYNAGDNFKVTKLPLAFFSRSIPNVETNVRVPGITHQRTGVYFLPEKVLVVNGPSVSAASYDALQIAVSSLEYVEADGHVSRDSQVIGKRWKFINRDGSRDRRFKDNVELPVVRCGILGLDICGTELKVMTTDPDAPGVVRAKLEALKANPGGLPTVRS